MAAAHRANPGASPATDPVTGTTASSVASPSTGSGTGGGSTAVTALAGEEPTIGRLVADASRDVSSLIHNEIELAKSELKVSIKAGGTGAGLFGAAAFLGLLAIIMLSVAFAYLLSMTGLHLAWCYLIVFAVYLLLAGLFALLGIKKVKQVRAPERAIHQAQETKQLLKRS